MAGVSSDRFYIHRFFNGSRTISQPSDQSSPVPIWSEVESAYRENGQEIVLGVRERYLGDLKQLADQAFVRSGGRIIDQSLGAGGGLSHHDLIFFENLAAVYAPEEIIVKSDDCGWNTASLRVLFPKARLTEVRHQSTPLANDIHTLTDMVFRTLGQSLDHVCGSLKDAGAGMLSDDAMIFISGSGTDETLKADIADALESCTTRPTIVVWRIFNDRLLEAISVVSESWPGEVSYIRRSSTMGFVFHGSTLPPEAATLLCAYDERVSLFRKDNFEEQMGTGSLPPSRLPIFEQIIQLYRDNGYKIMFGTENAFFGVGKDMHWASLCGPAEDAPEMIENFNINFPNDTKLTDVFVPYDAGQGIAMVELYLFQSLAKVFEPETIFIIGNAFGWSTIGLSLMYPKAKILAIDNLSDSPLSRHVFDLSKRIIGENHLNATVIEGTSPQDVSALVQQHLGGKIDLAFIDGLHTNDQQTLDYQAVKPLLSPSAAVAFHDVSMMDMLASFKDILTDWPGPGHLLSRTPSGMGLLYTDDLEDTVGTVAKHFIDPVFRPAL